MKNHRAILLPLLLVPVLVSASCRERTDRSEGTVVLSVSNFIGEPSLVSIANELAQEDPFVPFAIDLVTLSNFPKEPDVLPARLQDVELRSYEVSYRRRDTGTRVPPPIVQGVFGLVPAGLSFTLPNVTYLLTSQLATQPLKDLRDFGIDRETGTTVVVLDVTMRFFGRTLSGDDVATEPATFTLEIRP